MTPLVQAALLVLVLQGAHTADHIIGHPAHGVGVIPGYLGFLTIGGTLFLLWRNDPLAPAVSAFVGFVTAIGLAAIHLAPKWGIFSDPYSRLHLEFISWAIVIAGIIASLWLGVLGLRAMARQRPARQAHA
jgi:hypothetical protein